ncbi:MAG: ATP-dependent 6-phosphofructokinase, partial [Desulfobacteraceae bacterium]|nr:ATP-dependent 6-phosphofructokinase [Desulfobacteraceae bacterium]
MNDNSLITEIQTLGPTKIDSPIQKKNRSKFSKRFISDKDKILVNIKTDHLIYDLTPEAKMQGFELAGPREKIYFDPSKVKCAIATCGGLCPGLNDIIRAVVLELFHNYNSKNIYGIKHGLEGFIPKYGHEVIDLNPQSVSGVQDTGGTLIGSSRGSQDISLVVDCLERMNIGILFMVGGDGTLMAAKKIAEEVLERSLKISVIGIPKTIDNDIHLVSRSFGFDTAVDIATGAIRGAHNEAEAYPNGIGLIKLMGRHSGFLAATTALAQQDANFVLIPEIDIDLYGEHGFLNALEKRIKTSKHAVIITAEGAGQNFFKNQKKEYDASGNLKLNDIGIFLKNEISKWFKDKNIPVSLKYIDPSYM